MSKVLLAPLDPVHDIGLKMIARGLEQAGHETVLLPPDLTPEEIVSQTLRQEARTLLVSRTLGYGVAELLARFIDLADAAGLRAKTRIGIGGMAVRRELAAELGFDAGFGPGTTVEEVVCFVERREYVPDPTRTRKEKADMTAGYDYRYRHPGIAGKLETISAMIVDWAKVRTSPGVERARLRDELWDVARWRAREGNGELYEHYPALCGDVPRRFYETGELHPKTRRFTKEEVAGLESYLAETKARMSVLKLQHSRRRPLVFNQYGTGCPFMDIGHILASEAWGADGVGGRGRRGSWTGSSPTRRTGR